MTRQVGFKGPHSLAARAKMSKAHSGKTLSADHKRNIGLAVKGKLFGRKLSAETREKISKANLLRVYGPEHGEKVKRYFTPERRKQWSVQMKALWTPERRRAAAERLLLRGAIKSGTRPELAVQALLEVRGVQFETQFAFAGSVFLFDFAIPSRKVLIEVDGCYWHGCRRCKRLGLPANRRNDAAKNRLAREQGWKLIRIRECELKLGRP